MSVDIIYYTLSKKQKAVFEMINFNIEMEIFTIAVKGLILEVVESNGDSRYTEIYLI